MPTSNKKAQPTARTGTNHNSSQQQFFKKKVLAAARENKSINGE
jgi:hypothetical protein